MTAPMKTRIDSDRYLFATDEQRAEVDRYLAALGLTPTTVVEANATDEGTVRLVRPLAKWAGEHYQAAYCPEGRCCSVEPGPCSHREWLLLHETRPSPYPPPWLAWPDPLEEAPDGPR